MQECLFGRTAMEGDATQVRRDSRLRSTSVVHVLRSCPCLRKARNHASPLLLPITLSTPGNAIARSFLRRYVVQGRRGWWDLQACILMRLLGWLDKSIIFWSMLGNAVDSTRCPRQTATSSSSSSSSFSNYLSPGIPFPSVVAVPFTCTYDARPRSQWRQDRWRFQFPSTLLTSYCDHFSQLAGDRVSDQTKEF